MGRLGPGPNICLYCPAPALSEMGTALAGADPGSQPKLGDESTLESTNSSGSGVVHHSALCFGDLGFTPAGDILLLLFWLVKYI